MNRCRVLDVFGVRGPEPVHMTVLDTQQSFCMLVGMLVFRSVLHACRNVSFSQCSSAGLCAGLCAGLWAGLCAGLCDGVVQSFALDRSSSRIPSPIDVR